MSERAEWIRCIRLDGGKAFCGRDITLEWAFVDLGHADGAERNGSRLIACAECYDLAQGAQLRELK